MELDKMFLYRITHIDNIPFILQNGVTHKKSCNANPNYINIGDVSLIDVRLNKNVFVTNGYSSASNVEIILGEYIPFYFGVRMPMLYVIQKGGNFVNAATPPSRIIYVVCKLTELIKSNIEFVFTDGHATDNFTTFYDASQISKINNIIDWNAINATKWSGDGISLDLKRKNKLNF